MRKLFLSLALALATAPLASQTSDWVLDPAHTEIGFSVVHLGIAKVKGRFNQADAKIQLNEKDISKSKLSIEIPVSSVSTRHEKRDADLQGSSFFEADKHPKVTFKSTKIVKTAEGYDVTGDLSIRGNSKPVTLKAELSEALTTDWGAVKRAFSLRGSINRFDYGISFGAKSKVGTLVVSENVDLIIDGEIDQKK